MYASRRSSATPPLAPIAFGPDRLWHDVVHPNDDYIFVVRAIKNHDLTVCWRMMVGTPKEIVGEFLICRLSKTRYIDPLRIRAADDVTYDAVFACRIETLQDYE